MNKTAKNADMPAMPVYVDNSDWTLRWSIDTGTAKAGDIVGCECGRGYRQFKFKGVRYLTHRVIFFIFNGYMPEFVDHIDGNPANNNIANLREATKSQNMINRKTHRNNKAGRLGVDYMPKGNAWRAQIHKDGKKIYLGTYSTIIDAVAERIRAEKELHGEYSRSSSSNGNDALLAELERTK